MFNFISNISNFFSESKENDNKNKLLERYAEIQHKIQPKIVNKIKEKISEKKLYKIGQIFSNKYRKLKISYSLLSNTELSLQIFIQGIKQPISIYADSRFNFDGIKRSYKNHDSYLIIKFDFFPKENQILDIFVEHKNNIEIKFTNFELIY
mgnify:CR=1 FL=1